MSSNKPQTKQSCSLQTLHSIDSEHRTRLVLGKVDDRALQADAQSTQKVSTKLSKLHSCHSKHNTRHLAKSPNPNPPLFTTKNTTQIQPGPPRARDRDPGREEESLQVEAADPGEEVVEVMVGVDGVERQA